MKSIWSRPILRPIVGSHLDDVERAALRKARKHGEPVEFEFNSRIYRVHPVGTMDEVGYVVQKKGVMA